MHQRRAARSLWMMGLLAIIIVLAACDVGPPVGGPPQQAPSEEGPGVSEGPGSEEAPSEDDPGEQAASEAVASEADPASEQPADGYRLVWSDEFDGSALDTAKWNARHDDYASYDRACITARDENVVVEDGILTLRARREDYTCGSQQRAYTTAYLDTIGKASFTYGRFEVRAKSPNGPDNSTGLWPAFWLRPNDGGNGEIDVVELFGGPQYHDSANQAIHFTYEPSVKQDNLHTFTAGHPADGFHTYTTEWAPGVLRWYIDGEEVYRRDRSTTPWFDDAFDRDYHLRLNFQVGGWLGDPEATTALPADFEVDYVRVWQK